MRRLTRSLLLSAAILAALCLAAGCSTAKSAITSIASSRSGATSSASSTSDPTGDSPTATVSPPPLTPSVTPSPSPSVATTTATARPTVTITRTAASPSVTTVSGSPAASSGPASLLWLWILLGALVLIGLILLIVRLVGRHSAAAAGWRSKVIDVYAKGSALYDAMSVAETPGALAANDAAARWYDIQRRADDLAQNLYRLRETAPNEDDRGRVADVLATLQAARSAMDAERAPGGAGPQQAEIARRRLLDFEASLRALRGYDQPGP
jgi:hypothetical protein